ncbi:hypothetical protein M3Y97_00440900 [Aphelenchoides bicaudatus]|nr:hypothetical protein M3Y97_00440900 [Aphelenchoides bicaudatus]
MIDLLLEATNKSNWPSVKKLLYDHWVEQSAECFAVKEKNPWETQFDDKKINDNLLYPLAVALCQDKGLPRQRRECISQTAIRTHRLPLHGRNHSSRANLWPNV